MATDDQQPKIKLHWLDQSRSQRIVWLLEELKVPYELEIYHRDKSTFLAPEKLTQIHPLGKSPVVTITPPPGDGGDEQQPIVLAESGLITQYLCEHFPEGKRLTPNRWREGMEGKVGGETEEWLRWQYYLHYCEGSLMPLLVMTLVLSQLKSPKVPWMIRPITTMATNRILGAFVFPNAHKHMAMLDQQLATSPNEGKYLCGDRLTAADILMSFPLIAAKGRLDDVGPWKGGTWGQEFPRVLEYVEMLEGEEGYKKSVEKVNQAEEGGSPSSML